jgi:hypothetical protein
MIQDPLALADIRQSWSGVEKIGTRIKIGGFAASGVVGGRHPIPILDVAHNLPFVQAFAVLNDTLEHLWREGRFKAKDRRLGVLLAASQNVLPWRNFALIKEGVDKRNGVTHRGELLKRGDCWRFIKAVKAELGQMGVL